MVKGKTNHPIILRSVKAQYLSATLSDRHCILFWLAASKIDHSCRLVGIQLSLALVASQDDSRLERDVRWERSASNIYNWQLLIKLKLRIIWRLG